MSGCAEKSINWDEAGAHLGETMTVCGPVVDTKDLSQTGARAKKLMLGKMWQETGGGGFQIDIPNKVESQFPSIESYLGKKVCITGEILYNQRGERYEIEVTEPSQIEIQK